MPTLDWIGKKAVVNHHREVPYRLLKCDRDKSFGDPEAGNLLVQGDNLEALKALLPYYAGKVKCIYIDPPYNTGNESWIYNDNVNSPEMRAWLGKTVGKEAEDLSRHDKWLCMMYPRLRLLKEFLSDDGSIWVSIDDNEHHRMRMVLDELFGSKNFVVNIVVESNRRGQTYKDIAKTHENILVYSRSFDVSFGELEGRANKLPFKDSRGPYDLWELRNRNPRFDRSNRPNLYYPFYASENPSADGHHRISAERSEEFCIEIFPTNSAGQDGCWRWGREKVTQSTLLGEAPDVVARKTRDNKWTIWQRSRKSTTKAKSIWNEENFTTEAGTVALKAHGLGGKFDFPKPVALLSRLCSLIPDDEALYMDSFAGSGTLGEAVFAKNQEDGGRRRFILVEIDGQTAEEVTAVRLKSSSDLYSLNPARAPGFRYCTLGAPLFDPDGDINEAVAFRDLAAHVFFCETGSPIPKQATPANPLIGVFQGRAIYLLYNRDSAGVASQRAGNVLNLASLDRLPALENFSGQRVVYAEGCTIPAARLNAAGVVFKQIPYQIGGL